MVLDRSILEHTIVCSKEQEMALSKLGNKKINEMEPETILLEDYKEKITYLTAQTTRMLTRFNFFVTIKSALISGNFLIVSAVLYPSHRG